MIRPVEIGGVPIVGRPDGIAGGGVKLGGQRGEAGRRAYAPQRAVELARGERGPSVVAGREHPGRPRLRVEHRRGDRVRQPPDEGVDLVEPLPGAQPREPIRNVGERTGRGVRIVRTGSVRGRSPRPRPRGPDRATVEQPRKRRVLGAPHLAPRDHAPELRPGERDVQEAHRFGEFLDPLDGPRPLVRVEVEDFPEPFRRPQVIRGVRHARMPPRTAGIPRERAEHHGELESLRPVHRENLDELLVALEAELRGVVAAAGLGPAAVEPRDELRRRESFPCLRALRELGEMAEVREPAGAVGAPEEVGRAPLRFQQPQQNRADPLRLPVGAPVREPRRPAAPRVLFIAEREQRPRVETEHVAGERPPNHRLAPGRGDRPQEAFDLLRFAGVEHAAVVDLNAGHAALVQRAGHEPALLLRANQHRNIRTGERLALDRGLAARAEVQEADHLVGGRARDRGDHVSLGEEPIVVPAREKP